MKSSEMGEKPIDEHIKAARKAYGLSRVRAAKQWGICAATIRSWEEKQRAPSRTLPCPNYPDTCST